MLADAHLRFLDIDAATLQTLQRAMPQLRRWFRRNARELPWRSTRDPYAIWVSEVMLQQTQVATVIPYYERWMHALPTVSALAQSSEQRVLQLWQGLGYYSRARNLRRAARAVVEAHGGTIPREPELFGRLPGVGAYTTGAVLSIAFGTPLAAVDGNVKRVLARITALNNAPSIQRAHVALSALAQALVPKRAASAHNQALMELGALVCQPRTVDCNRCPLRTVCRAYTTGDPLAFPIANKRSAPPHHHVAVAIVWRGKDLLLYQRPYGGMLAGLWDLPAQRIDSKPTQAPPPKLLQHLDAHYGIRVGKATALPPVKHAYTHFRITLHPFRFEMSGHRSVRALHDDITWHWVSPQKRADFPTPRSTQKVLTALLAYRNQVA